MRPCSIQANGVARSKSSARWLKEHFDDPYVKRAQAEGWRSRAVFKLEELLERDRLLKPGMVVVDLGAAPGGWSQMIRERLGDAVRIVALDILPMQGISGVEFIEGDFRDEAVVQRLEATLGGVKPDLVLSDMAPNMSGVNEVDQARAMDLAELAQEFARVHLKPGGAFLAKVIQGGTESALLAALKRDFSTVKHVKPAASRADSAELYVLATGFRGVR